VKLGRRVNFLAKGGKDSRGNILVSGKRGEGEEGGVSCRIGSGRDRQGVCLETTKQRGKGRRDMLESRKEKVACGCGDRCGP